MIGGSESEKDWKMLYWLTLNTKERTTSHGMQVVSRNEKGKGMDSP